MFELVDAPLVWMPVEWPGLVQGKDEAIAEAVTHRVELLVELVAKDEFRALFQLDDAGEMTGDAVDEDAVWTRLVRGWRKIVANGSPVPFTPDNGKRLMARPGFMIGFALAYFQAMGGRVKEREGNSENSQSGGRVDEATAGTNTDATKA